MKIKQLMPLSGRLAAVFVLFFSSLAFAWVGGVDIPEQAQWSGVRGGVFNPNLMASGRLFYIAAIPETKPIPWTILRGEAAYMRIYVPAGIQQVNMGINAVALAASQSVLFKDFGETTCGETAQLPPTPKASEIAANIGNEWKVLTGASNVSHQRLNTDFFNGGSCLLFGFYNQDNLNQSGVKLDDVSLTYMVKDEDLFSQWASKGEVIYTARSAIESPVKQVATNIPVNTGNANKTSRLITHEWIGGVNIPERIDWQGRTGGVFDPAKINPNNNALYYIAAVPETKPIPWTINRGEGAYFTVYFPAGMGKLSMGINARSLAASQSVSFYDYGEHDCNNFTLPPVPVSSDFTNGGAQAGWKVLTGASNVVHKRDENSGFFITGSCLMYGFFNLNNMYTGGIQLDEVSFTYSIKDKGVFTAWAQGKDSDSDGVMDDKDQCPTTASGSIVDSVGCPLPIDSDGDNVTDDVDQCPSTPLGTAVDTKGCAKQATEDTRDDDKDGVKNALDQCPNTADNARVDAQGCSTVDGDGDGTTDDKDRCPNTGRDVTIGTDGCTVVDSDVDGVNDDLDQCADSAKNAKVDSKGCVATPVPSVNPCGSAAFCIKNGKLILPAVKLDKGNYQSVELAITAEASGAESLWLEKLNPTTQP